MNKFVSRFRSLVTAVLSGFDRLVFRGHLQALMRQNGMHHFLRDAGVQLVEFGTFSKAVTERLKQSVLDEAKRQQRPIRYLPSATISKEELARQILSEHPIEQGLICVLSAIEPCQTFEYHRSVNRDERGLRLRPNKCLHLYQYRLHPQFGFMNARIQTWFPFNIQICLNGREWLTRQLLAEQQSDFDRLDNCLTRLGDPEMAQRLMQDQLKIDWPGHLKTIARELNPQHEAMFGSSPMDYYWSAHQTEWATDVLFRDPRALAQVYPQLVRYAMHHFQSADVMRFLARKAPGHFKGQIVTGFKDRAEGVRVKHRVGANSIKMYDKAGSVLRIETTITNPTDFKVFRPVQNDPHSQFQWLPMRKGVADIHRRAQVSQRSNETYLDALAVVEDTTACSTIFDRVSAPVLVGTRRVRALGLTDPVDITLLQAISRGEFATSGFRNRDIRQQLYPHAASADKIERRRLSSKTGRLLRLLRAHGIIQKITKTTRYRLTPRGQCLVAALFATRNANIKQLLAIAA